MSHVKHTIPVQKMICTSCEKVIAKEISALPGVKTVNVSFKHGKAEVEFDDHKVSLTKIKKASGSRMSPSFLRLLAIVRTGSPLLTTKILLPVAVGSTGSVASLNQR